MTIRVQIFEMGDNMTRNELYERILQTANDDERIRAVTLEGSAVTNVSVKDEYSDFDITFFVRDIREFLMDKQYMQTFGDILILQKPDDWYNHPYDYNGTDNFAYLCQYKDGNRIDLTLVDVSRIKDQLNFSEPRKVLINKDGFKELKDITTIDAFIIQKPTEFEYLNTCNEFRWLSIYISKGICRQEFYYAKKVMDQYAMDMFIKMLNFKVALDHDFKITLGSNSKYLKNYLNVEDMNRFQNIFSDGNYENMKQKLFLMYDYFDELAEYVGTSLGYPHDREETQNVRNFIAKRLEKV